ncbi:syncoilin isoform X2 [Bombina bombina]|uniref:syncoilin isoform X2 n=1 Tax=Bombina bombina TaxID=8345 RepID=UPI00235AD261|nr:syncoilin isoform X2 [Bombina bombina]
MSNLEEEDKNSQEVRVRQESPVYHPSSPLTPEPPSLEEVGVHFQLCIAAVEDLEREREELIRELTLLREPTLEAVCQAHEEVIQAFGQKARVELEMDTLREEVRTIRQRLFRVTRECVSYQYQLERQRQEQEQNLTKRSNLETLATRLSEELDQLRDSFSQQREGAQRRLRRPSTRNVPRELQERRRLSAELQSLTEEQHNSLEEQYEPRLLQLLQRNENGVRALHVAQEELQKLREDCRPLEGEACRLRVQKSSFQEQIVMLKRKREEEVLLFRIQELEDRRRDIKTSVQLQQQKNKEIEELRKSLAHELAIYKGCLEIYGQLFKSVTKKE